MNNRKQHGEKKNSDRLLKIAIIVVLLVLILLVVIGRCVAPKFNEEQGDGIWGDASLGIDARVDEELKDYRNIAIYGLDNRNRSDIIMVFSLNKTNKEARVISVFRDTYMQISPNHTYTFGGVKHDFFKCNHSFFVSGYRTSLIMLNRHLDLNIREYIAMDWDAIEHFVDSIGGLKVEDSLLNGKQAVAYLRIRKRPGQNAATRSMKNQTVLVDMFKKSKDYGLTKRMKIFDENVDNLQTNMSRNTLTDTLNLLATYELEPQEKGWPRSYSILWDDSYGYYYYVPETLESCVANLHFDMFGQEQYQVTDTCQGLSDEIAKKEHLVKVDN